MSYKASLVVTLVTEFVSIERFRPDAPIVRMVNPRIIPKSRVNSLDVVLLEDVSMFSQGKASVKVLWKLATKARRSREWMHLLHDLMHNGKAIVH